MRIIEISALDNGAHRNQNGSFKSVPEGWAIIPPALKVPASFPFVDIEVEAIGGKPTVVSMTEREVPQPETIEPSHSELDDIAAMLIDQEYRLTLLEMGVGA